MKKALLILRIPIETVLGLLNLSGSLLLSPYVYSSYFPQVLVIGFLGMPRRQLGSSTPDPLFSFNPIAMLIGWVVVALLFLNGLLWFKDVLHIIRKLRTKQPAA